jgi:hypothetical protein
VRNNELTTEARSVVVALLLTVDAAARLAPKVRKHYPDNDAAALGYADRHLGTRPSTPTPN